MVVAARMIALSEKAGRRLLAVALPSRGRPAPEHRRRSATGETACHDGFTGSPPNGANTDNSNLVMWSLHWATHRDLEDAGGAVVRDAVLVAAVARGDPQSAVRARLDGPDPPELPLEVRHRRGRRVTGDLHRPQSLAAQRAHVQRVVQDGQPARRSGGHRPGLDRRGECRIPARAGRAFAPGPAVVGALTDEVQLVHDAVAQLGFPEPPARVERQAFEVAVAVAPDVPGVAAVGIEG